MPPATDKPIIVPVPTELLSLSPPPAVPVLEGVAEDEKDVLVVSPEVEEVTVTVEVCGVWSEDVRDWLVSELLD